MATGNKRSLKEAVRLAAALEGVIADVRERGGKPWKVELLSYWGGVPDLKGLPEKVAKARAIADRLQSMGHVCSFDVLDTGGLDVYYDLA